MKYRTIDFRPVAQPGWRVILLNHPNGWRSVPLAGWLIQEEIETPRYDDEYATGERRIVAATTEGFEVGSAEWEDEFWLVLGPGEDDPTTVQEIEHREFLAHVRQVRRANAVKDTP